jgi:hypothetical protein
MYRNVPGIAVLDFNFPVNSSISKQMPRPTKEMLMAKHAFAIH